jgi:hypothetical protein
MIRFFVFFAFFLIFFDFSEKVNAQSTLSFCGPGAASWSNDSCVSLCSENTVAGLAVNNAGFCVGKATKYELTIRKVEIGTSAGINGYRCTLFVGELITDFGSTTVNEIVKRRPVTEKCREKVIYDRVYLYTDRKIKIAGNTVYPGSATKVARTTSACPTDSVTTVTDLSWLDSTLTTATWGNAALCAGKKTGMNTFVIKSKKDSLSTDDYVALSNQENEFDDFKQFFSVSGGTTNSDGFYMDSGSTIFGAKLNPKDPDQIIYFIKADAQNTFIKGLNKTLKNPISFEINYFSANRDKDFGLRFWFVNLAGVLNFMGVSPYDNGMYFTFTENFN